MKMRKTLSLCAAGLLGAVMVVSATFAWFTANSSVVNSLQTNTLSDGSVDIVEVFTPPTEWRPGQTVTKQVAAANNGEGDVLVRVSFEEVMLWLQRPAAGNDTALSGAQIPQIFNAAPYLADPWKDTTGLTMSGKPDNVTVRVKTHVADGKTAYSFVAMHPLTGDYAGKYQRVTADFQVTGTTVVMSNVKYWAFNGYTKAEAAWAKFADPKTGETPEIRAYDQIKNPIVDKLNKKIVLNYTDYDDLDTPTPNKWFYNAQDGFFYYIGKLEPGQSSGTLLESLTLDPSADNAYSGMKFDLIVNLEAIQNTADALSSASGWKLDPASALYTELKKHCAA
ncbi:MAG: BsaA family SipW-dependent biofilm matrix protein [Propionibacteriaceae bacterium]|jgi:hypothetical protein|nr:BsaA family SipW-dependent biofilm matrix protein [Propionibacteriaceae bacterium]